MTISSMRMWTLCVMRNTSVSLIEDASLFSLNNKKSVID